jgi:hypothetical protein
MRLGLASTARSAPLWPRSQLSGFPRERAWLLIGRFFAQLLNKALDRRQGDQRSTVEVNHLKSFPCYHLPDFCLTNVKQHSSIFL